MFLSYQQKTVSNVVPTAADLTIPANATGAILQAETQNIRYTMDNSTDPTQTKGMLLRAAVATYTADPPQQFTVEDLLRIRFVRGAGSDAVLNIHYFAGRDV